MDPLEHPYAARQPWRYTTHGPAVDLPAIDQAAFAADVRALRAELEAGVGTADLRHLQRMAKWGRACTVLGYLLCWFPNPLSVLLLSLGNVARWTMVSHHVLHRGYDRVPGVPRHYTSAVYARGWRRLLDWPDWLHPAAWSHEHNHLHHLHTGELDDPDLPEHNAWLLRLRQCPRPLKAVLLLILMLSWKLIYYAPNTWFAWRLQQRSAGVPRRERPAAGAAWRLLYPGERLILPLSTETPRFWLQCLLPYAVWRFGLLPAPFALLGSGAWLCALLSLVLAELLANLHAFIIIVPNHAGADVYRYDDHFRDHGEFCLRQVCGSVNYPGGSDLRDFLHGYLNYQIEHHLWPDLPMLKYREAAPRLKALCARHGVPYIEEPVQRRFALLWSNLTGDSTMRRVAARPQAR